MAISEETKRDLLIAITSMLFIVFITGIGSEGSGTEAEEIIIS